MIKLQNIISEIITEYEGGEPLLFTHDCVDSYRGQNYCNLIARDKDGNFVGSINFSTYGKKIHISMINTKGPERRKGVATAMAKELQKEYPDYEIIWGMTTSFGTKFLDKLPRTFKSGQWRVNLKEIISPHEKAKTTDKERGYIGIVKNGRVYGYDDMVPHVFQTLHAEIEFGAPNDGKFRYLYLSNVVYWNKFPPTDEERLVVEDWLAKKKVKVKAHRSVWNKQGEALSPIINL